MYVYMYTRNLLLSLLLDRNPALGYIALPYPSYPIRLMHGMAWHGMAWLHMAWHGMALHGMEWHGIA